MLRFFFQTWLFCTTLYWSYQFFDICAIEWVLRYEEVLVMDTGSFIFFLIFALTFFFFLNFVFTPKDLLLLSIVGVRYASLCTQSYFGFLNIWDFDFFTFFVEQNTTFSRFMQFSYCLVVVIFSIGVFLPLHFPLIGLVSVIFGCLFMGAGAFVTLTFSQGGLLVLLFGYFFLLRYRFFSAVRKTHSFPITKHE